ncbi:MAG: type II secretion system F family protein [Nocardioides sp.]
MSGAWWGAVLGAAIGGGLWLVCARVAAIRRPALVDRVFPYVRDVHTAATALRRRNRLPSTGRGVDGIGAVVHNVFGPSLRAAAEATERVLGGAASVQRRLIRAGLEKSVHEFRIEQVLWGLAGFAMAAALGLLEATRDPSGAVASILFCLAAFVVGVLLRENRLTVQARARERRIVAEFPTVAELLALTVAAGEGPVAALDRVVRRSGGELSGELAKVQAAIRTGEPVGSAFDRMAADTGLPIVARFAQGVAVAVERGTPLADVLHAQAADVRESRRRELIETAARKEVAMMVPVVFLVLPITVLFAFWPGVVGLSLTTP